MDAAAQRCDYSDARIVHSKEESISTRNGLEAALARALEVAESQPGAAASPLTHEAPARGSHESPCERDPLAVSADDKLEVLLGADAAMRGDPAIAVTSAVRDRIEAVAASGGGDASAQAAVDLLEATVREDIGTDRATARPLAHGVRRPARLLVDRTDGGRPLRGSCRRAGGGRGALALGGGAATRLFALTRGEPGRQAQSLALGDHTCSTRGERPTSYLSSLDQQSERRRASHLPPPWLA